MIIGPVGLSSRTRHAASSEARPGKGEGESGRGVADAQVEPQALLACLPLGAVEAFRPQGLRAGRTDKGGGGEFWSKEVDWGGTDKLLVNGDMWIRRAKSEDDIDKVGLI